MFTVANDRVMTTRELLYSEMKTDDPLYDKLFSSCFIAAVVEEPEMSGSRKRWGLNLDKAPLVVANDNVKNNNGFHKDTPTVNQMRNLGGVDIGRKDLPYGEYSLVSGGAIIYYGGKILCLKRDKYAPQDPGILTTPAGRMSEWLSTMSSLELAEEIIPVVKHDRSGKLMTLGGFREGCRQISESDIIVKKQRQIAKMFNYFDKMGTDEARILEQIAGIDDIIPINLDEFICKNMVDEKADQVFTFDNLKIKDQCSGYVFFDKKNNTLEFREVFDLTLPGFSLYAILPGEYFQINEETIAVNDTQVLSKDEMVTGFRNGSIKVVPTLRAYLSRIEGEDQVLNFFSKSAM